MRAAYCGFALGLGLLSKLTMVAFVPVTAVALAIGLIRATPRDRARLTACAVLAAAVLPLLYAAVSLGVFDRSLFGRTSADAPILEGVQSSRAEQLSYTWQLLLPKLWFMDDQFAYSPPTDLWLHGLTGLFGWLDTPFSSGTYRLGAWIFVALASATVASLARHRRAVARNWPVLVLCVVAFVSLWLLIGAASYSYRQGNGGQFEQARYALPLLPIYGLCAATLTRLATGRAASVVAAGLVGLTVVHVLLAQLLVIQRFYV